MKVNLTLGYDSDERKRTPMLKVLFGYFAAAMAGLTRHAVRSNDKHNPGEPVHWARGKSMDHDECSLRHLVDSAEIRAWLRDNPTHPDRDAVVTMLEHELDAKVWRACAESQEFYEEFRGAPLSFSSRLPAPVVPSGTVEFPLIPDDFDALVQEFNAPGDSSKLPQIVGGAEWGCAWAIVCGLGQLLSRHSSYADAESCLREMLAPPPVNTPEELAELERIRGKVVLVGGPGLVDGGHFELTPEGVQPADRGHDFPLFTDCPSERGNLVDEPVARMPGEFAYERCGHMSSTKRVCTLVAQHDDRAHSDGRVIWSE